jgi:hypothetical protein
VIFRRAFFWGNYRQGADYLQPRHPARAAVCPAVRPFRIIFRGCYSWRSLQRHNGDGCVGPQTGLGTRARPCASRLRRYDTLTLVCSSVLLYAHGFPWELAVPSAAVPPARRTGRATGEPWGAPCQTTLVVQLTEGTLVRSRSAAEPARNAKREKLVRERCERGGMTAASYGVMSPEGRARFAGLRPAKRARPRLADPSNVTTSEQPQRPAQIISSHPALGLHV